MRLLSIIALLAILSVVHSEACWKGAWGRGVGTIPDSCEAGKTVQSSLCYKDCPSSEWTKIGPVCWNYNVTPIKSQPIGVGTPMKCSPDLNTDAGLCYVDCPPDTHGIGPVCWG